MFTQQTTKPATFRDALRMAARHDRRNEVRNGLTFILPNDYAIREGEVEDGTLYLLVLGRGASLRWHEDTDTYTVVRRGVPGLSMHRDAFAAVKQFLAIVEGV